MQMSAAGGRGQTAAVLWTGGKDCNLALYHAREQGVGVRELVTFAPTNGDFKAHSLSVMSAQARSLGLPHRIVRMREPTARSYDSALRQLDAAGIAVIVTGDIDTVGGFPSWITERADAAGVGVLRPLWGRSRLSVLQELAHGGFEAVLTAVRSPPLERGWLGRSLLEAGTLSELREAAATADFDLAGEQGEYHTMVLDGPGFDHPVALGPTRPEREGDLWYLQRQG